VPGSSCSYFGRVASSPIIRVWSGHVLKSYKMVRALDAVPRWSLIDQSIHRNAKRTKIEELEQDQQHFYMEGGAIGGCSNVVDNRLRVTSKKAISG